MAKSTRSKVKRSFRAKKREQGVYAATEAARLNRLHQKLRAVTERDAEGDVAIEDAEESPEQNGVVDEGGSYLYFCLGLVDHLDVTPEAVEWIVRSGL